MKFTTAVSALLCAGLALATPLENKTLRRRSTIKKTAQPVMHETVNINDTYAVSYSENWAGAVLVGTGYTTVTGTMTVPSLSGSGGAAFWVGIDGDTCDALWQTGILYYDGEWEAWYEWIPAASVAFSGITVSPGNSLTFTITVSSVSGGTATIVNHSTGQTVTKTVSGESTHLCEYNAEWIVEDFEECSGSSCEFVPFADFGSVEFTSCSATHSGSTVDTTGATIFDIEQSSVLTSCSASGSTVSCSYV